LLDIATQQDPNGDIAMVVEVLNQMNPMLQDAPAYPSNAQFGHKVTMRSSLPAVAFTRINEGYTRSLSTTEQRVDTIGILTGMSEVDAKMVKVIGASKFNAFRDNEDMAFVEAMGQEIAQTFLYGNELTAPAEFTGLQPRLTTLATAITGSQVVAHHGSPTGSDYTSMYGVDWGPRGAHIIYPKDGGLAGIETRDLGLQLVNDVSSNSFPAFVTTYTWCIGMAVEDPRRISRLCNIDVSQALADTSTFIKESLIPMSNRLPPKAGHQRVWYTSRDIVSAYELQVERKSNVWFSYQEYQGEKMLHFKGDPIRAMDQVSQAESLVS